MPDALPVVTFRTGSARIEVIADALDYNGATFKRGARFDVPVLLAHRMAEDGSVRFVTLRSLSSQPRRSWVNAWKDA